MSEKTRKPDKGRFQSSAKNTAWFLLNIIFTVIYLFWRTFYTLPLGHGMISVMAGIILLSIEIIGALEAFIHYWNMYRVKTYELPAVPESEYPHVDVFIATYNESSDILYKTINGCVHMDYPDLSKVHIHLCDDGRRTEMKELAASMGINYIDRNDNLHAKAGNLNNAMSRTFAPLVVTLDADMIPKHDFLMKTVPYFVDEEIKNREREEKDRVHIGFVQSPQAFYNPDLYQFYLFSENRIPNEQDYFYRDIQVGRNKSNSVIYGGSNTVLSRKAIEDIGGFYTDSITEDFATGILIQQAKYRCIAINEVLASGLSPTTLKDLIQQRVRWARGVISTSRKLGFMFTRKLTAAQKLNYTASMWYWYFPIKMLVYIMAPVMYATFGYLVIECTLPEILIFWLPMYISSNATLRILSGNIRNTKWSRVYETALFPFLFFPVLLETFGISMKKFKVTQKGGMTSEKGKNFVYSTPFIILIVLSVIGIINSVRTMFVTSSMNSSVILFWLIANMFSLIMALFFIQGRSFMRRSERVSAELECEIETEYEKIRCRTRDISETGISAMIARTHFIDDQKEVSIRVWSQRYSADLKARVVHVSKANNEWKYAFEITGLDEKCKSEYMQLLYDRVPTFPMQLNDSLSSFDDLRINITNRTKPVIFANRRLARVDVSDVAVDQCANKIKIINFNYRYIAFDDVAEEKEMSLKLSNGLVLKCEYNRDIRDNIKLYTVENIEEIYNNPLDRKLLSEWLQNKHLDNMYVEKEMKIEEKSEEFSEMDAL